MEKIIKPFYKNIDQVLAYLEKEIFALPSQPFPKTRQEACDATEDAGVYLLYFEDKLVYVGETKAFNSRLNDHTYDSKIFSQAKKKSGRTNRDDVRIWMSSRFSYKFLPIKFGRLELEMFIVENSQARNHELWNKKVTRGSWLKK